MDFITSACVFDANLSPQGVLPLCKLGNTVLNGTLNPTRPRVYLAPLGTLPFHNFADAILDHVCDISLIGSGNHGHRPVGSSARRMDRMRHGLASQNEK